MTGSRLPRTPRLTSSFVDQIEWSPKLRRQQGGRTFFKGIEVYSDFDWESVVGHPQITFTNCKSLGVYIRRHSDKDKRRALILTDQDQKPEGVKRDHGRFDIFIVNLPRYKTVDKNDAAAAYFAGLAGSPVIDIDELSKRTFTENEIAQILDALGTPEALSAWALRSPERFSALDPGGITDGIEPQRLVEMLKSKLPDLDEDQLHLLVELLASEDFPTNVLRTAHLARRKKAADEFAAALTAGRWDEKTWQKFFEREEWIFGHGLLYLYLTTVEREATTGGTDVTGSGAQIADWLKRTGGHASFAAIVDIKLPSKKLVNAAPTRNGAHAIHPDLADAVAQALANCDVWNREGSKHEKNIKKAEREGWQTAHPRGILVVGNCESLVTEDMTRSFELFRRHLHGVEIITFDELLQRTNALVSEMTQPEGTT